MRRRETRRTEMDSIEMKSQSSGSSGMIRRSVVSFHDVSYDVSIRHARHPCTKTSRRILNKISGFFPPGMNAILGPSGCGKTSLLDILARRKDIRGLTGQILVDGQLQPKNFKCMTGYVSQDDIIMGSLTVRENIMFSANLRLRRKMTEREKGRLVSDVINELGLTKCADSKVGNEFTRGISGGERKRTNIGMELVISPSFLFLDEPTTGLDASTAHAVMASLRGLSRRGRTIIFSIHQPRYAIYEQIDRLLLLARGRTVYHGPAREALQYFSSIGFVCEQHNNPPDFFLDIINGDSTAAKLETQSTNIFQKDTDKENSDKSVKIAQENESSTIQNIQDLNSQVVDDSNNNLSKTLVSTSVVDINCNIQHKNTEHTILSNEINENFEVISSDNGQNNPIEMDKFKIEHKEDINQHGKTNLEQHIAITKDPLLENCSQEKGNNENHLSDLQLENKLSNISQETGATALNPDVRTSKAAEIHNEEYVHHSQVGSTPTSDIHVYVHNGIAESINNDVSDRYTDAYSILPSSMESTSQVVNDIRLSSNDVSDPKEPTSESQILDYSTSVHAEILPLRCQNLEIAEKFLPESKSLKPEMIEPKIVIQNITEIEGIHQISSEKDTHNGIESESTQLNTIEIEQIEEIEVLCEMVEYAEIPEVTDDSEVQIDLDEEEDSNNLSKHLSRKFKKSIWNIENDEYLKTVWNRFEESGGQKELMKANIRFTAPYATPFLTQLLYLSRRTLLSVVCSPQTSILQFVVVLFFGLVIGLIYYQLEMEFPSGIQNRTGGFFFICVAQMFGNMSAVDIFLKDRKMFIHENSSGFYRVSAYYISKLCCDVIPMRFLPLMVFAPITYFMMGLRVDASNFFVFFCNLFLTTMSLSSLGFLISASVTVSAIGSLYFALVYVTMTIFGGYMVNLTTMVSWISWMKYLSINYYSLNTFYINEFGDQEYYTLSNNGTRIPLPGAGNWYLDTQGVPHGTEWDLWQNIQALALITIGLQAFTYIQLRRIKKHS